MAQSNLHQSKASGPGVPLWITGGAKPSDDPRKKTFEDLVCENVGHEWADAGGGLLVCMVCRAEKWGHPGD